MVEISSTAVAEIERIKHNRQMSDSLLRLRVKSGGCSGLFYDLELEDIPERLRDDLAPLDHLLDKESDSPHSAASETRNLQDRKIEIKGIHLIVDAQSWRYVEHLKLDYSEDLMGGGFRFYNPQIENTCGCGISFAAIE